MWLSNINQKRQWKRYKKRNEVTLVSLKNWFTTKKTLINQHNLLCTKLDVLRQLIKHAPNIEELRIVEEAKTDWIKELHYTKSDSFAIRSWIVKAMISAFDDFFDDFENANDFIEIQLGNKYSSFSVLIQRTNKLSPATKCTQLEKQNKELEEYVVQLEEQMT